MLNELWLSLPHTTLLNTSHSLDILEIMTSRLCAQFLHMRGGNAARALEVANRACYKLVADMHYEARIQAITYCAHIEGRKVKKEVVINMRLTREQFLRVTY